MRKALAHKVGFDSRYQSSKLNLLSRPCKEPSKACFALKNGLRALSPEGAAGQPTFANLLSIEESFSAPKHELQNETGPTHCHCRRIDAVGHRCTASGFYSPPIAGIGPPS